MYRSLLFGLAAILVTTDPGQAQSGKIVTANMTTGTVSIIDAATGRDIGQVATAVAPHEVAISHDGRWAVISEYGDRSAVGSTLLVVEVASGTINRRIDLGTLTRPHGIHFLPGDQRLVVTSEAAGVVGLVDFAKGSVAATVPTGAQLSHMISITTDGKRGYVTNVRPGSVSVIDLLANTMQGPIDVGTMVEGVAVTPDGREVWAGGNTSGRIHIVDPVAGKVTATVEGFGMPYRIAMTPNGQTAVVTDPGTERIHLVDVPGRRIVTSIDVPGGGAGAASPQGVTIADDGRAAIVTLKGSAEVAWVDLETGKIVRRYPTGGGADGVGWVR